MSVIIEGFGKLEPKLKRFGDIGKFFDDTLEQVAVDLLNDLTESTPFDELGLAPHTKNMWELRRLDTAIFTVDNTKVSQDGKHSIAGILNDGRKEVRPKKAKRLYIPLSRKGKRKKLGQPIPKDSKWGIDYILADKAKAFPGTNFIDKAEKTAQKNLRNSIAKKIRSVF